MEDDVDIEMIDPDEEGQKKEVPDTVMEEADEKDNEGSDDNDKTDDEKDLLQVINEIESGKHNELVDEAQLNQDKVIQDNINRQTSEMQELEGEVKNKEALLEAIKNSQRELEGTLLNAMKEEYHKKIE